MKIATLCVIQIYGLFFILLGGCCLTGHLFGIPAMDTFGSKSDMAPSTGVGFLAIGMSYFVIAKFIHGKHEKPFGGRNP